MMMMMMRNQWKHFQQFPVKFWKPKTKLLVVLLLPSLLLILRPLVALFLVLLVLPACQAMVEAMR